MSDTKIKTLDELSDELRAWLQQNGLPQESADEVVLTPGLTDEQIAYLYDFIDRWDGAARADREAVAKLKPTAENFYNYHWKPNPNRRYGSEHEYWLLFAEAYAEHRLKAAQDALKNLVNKLNAVSQQLNYALAVADSHGHKYEGESFGPELQEAEEVLRDAEGQDAPGGS
jgi:hypothetical protein